MADFPALCARIETALALLDEVSRIIDLLHDAEFEERSDPAGTAERAAWITSEARPDGIPVGSLGPIPEQGRAAFRDLANGVRLARRR